MREKTQAGYVLGKTATAQDLWVSSRRALLPTSMIGTIMMVKIMMVMMGKT